MTVSFRIISTTRCAPPRSESHLEDADKHLSPNRGIKTANIPLVPGVPLPHEVHTARKALIVGLIRVARANCPDQAEQVAHSTLIRKAAYVDRMSVAEEIAGSRKLFQQHGWPSIDVTRRSIEETAAGNHRSVEGNIGSDLSLRVEPCPRSVLRSGIANDRLVLASSSKARRRC